MAYSVPIVYVEKLRMLNKKRVKNIGMGCIESLVITALFLIASKFLHDPLFLKSPFPWIWFAPVIVALTYGLGPAILSIVFFLGVYLYFHPEQRFSFFF